MMKPRWLLKFLPCFRLTRTPPSRIYYFEWESNLAVYGRWNSFTNVLRSRQKSHCLLHENKQAARHLVQIILLYATYNSFVAVAYLFLFLFFFPGNNEYTVVCARVLWLIEVEVLIKPYFEINFRSGLVN